MTENHYKLLIINTLRHCASIFRLFIKLLSLRISKLFLLLWSEAFSIALTMKKSAILILIIILSSHLTAQVETGIEVLRKTGFEALKHKKVGLITNPTGIDAQLRSTVDILFEAPEVNLVALFGPEHGVRGNIAAGEKVDSNTDAITGLPVYSLYGKTRKPTPEMLKGIDILVYDIQDIGSRSYTFISTLGLAMEAAAENDIEFMVLDRPNPLGGNKFEGPIVEPEYTSFVSQYPIPYVHGLTVGELAQFLNDNGLLANKAKCRLSIIKMNGWKREMDFEATGLPWIPSSPHIPHAHTPFYYPVSGIAGELYVLNIGVGYTLPFQLFGADWIDGSRLADSLQELNIPGVMFRPVHYKPYYSTFSGQNIEGVQVHLTEPEKAPLSLIQFYVLQELHKLHPEKNIFEMCDHARLNMFDKVCGTDKVRKQFSESFLVKDILNLWTKDAEEFEKLVKEDFLY